MKAEAFEAELRWLHNVWDCQGCIAWPEPVNGTEFEIPGIEVSKYLYSYCGNYDGVSDVGSYVDRLLIQLLTDVENQLYN